MRFSTKTSPTVSDRLEQGLLDTSVVVDLDLLEPEQLPRDVAISVVTLAELCAGPSATDDMSERARRQDRLQRTEAVFDPLPFDVESARAYGRVYAAVVEQGRKPRRRFADLLIASTALSAQLPLVTRNADDFVGLEHLVTIVEV